MTANMSISEKMKCPRCGADMNHHADKVLRSEGAEAALRSSVWSQCCRTTQLPGLRGGSVAALFVNRLQTRLSWWTAG